MPVPAKETHDQGTPTVNKLITATVLLIVGTSVLMAAVPAVVRLIDAVTPLVLVVGTFAVVWQLVNYFTRQ